LKRGSGCALGGAGCSAGFVWCIRRAMALRSNAAYRRVFRASIVYLTALFAVMLATRSSPSQCGHGISRPACSGGTFSVVPHGQDTNA